MAGARYSAGKFPVNAPAAACNPPAPARTAPAANFRAGRFLGVVMGILKKWVILVKSIYEIIFYLYI